MTLPETYLVVVDYGDAFSPNLHVPETPIGSTFKEAVSEIAAGDYDARIEAVIRMKPGAVFDDVSKEVAAHLSYCQNLSPEAANFVDYCGLEVRYPNAAE